jgi:tRNA(Ile)-lysidine synthetase-like protein
MEQEMRQERQNAKEDETEGVSILNKCWTIYREAMTPLLTAAVESVPPGAWAVGVSGGADSVALLRLLLSRSDLSLHVVHLNHQTRGHESEEDARFVAGLAAEFGLTCTIDHRSNLEREATDLPRNPSARYRRARISLFRRVIEDAKLKGVLLAHHSDDQAETILHRLHRGSGVAGLTGMSQDTVIGGLRCVRPLLGIRREALRNWLAECGQSWREDPSNRSPKYLRNQLRLLLGGNPAFSEALLQLGTACRSLRDWERSMIRPTSAVLSVEEIADLPSILARANARSWLIAQGVSRGNIEPQSVDRLIAMCTDASTPARMPFPGMIVARRRGKIEALAGRAGKRATNDYQQPLEVDEGSN